MNTCLYCGVREGQPHEVECPRPEYDSPDCTTHSLRCIIHHQLMTLSGVVLDRARAHECRGYHCSQCAPVEIEAALQRIARRLEDDRRPL